MEKFSLTYKALNVAERNTFFIIIITNIFQSSIKTERQKVSEKMNI